MTRLAILGSTGSIGVNALDVVRRNSGRFSISFLTAKNNVDLLARQALEFQPTAVAVSDEQGYEKLKQALSGTHVRILCGAKALETLSREEGYDTLVAAIVGAAGLLPTVEALRRGKRVALANKETLVCAGTVVKELIFQHGASIIPIDSEHSALFQCLVGETVDHVERIILTASGGPFLHTPAESFKDITVERALRHPNWTMGAKITIDSATLMNKGLEVIEAHWLFALPRKKISVLVHPQSIVHSMVEFIDGSIKAQMGVPDMKVPIQYALTYPERVESTFDRVDWTKTSRLEFLDPDPIRFPCLQLAYDALAAEGTMPAVLNAANECLVEKFLKRTIRFTDIPAGICHAMEVHDVIHDPSLDDIVNADRWAREMINEKYKD
jgi:1-deoxy-D-xylulose-5-phosphate reductoisomerase